MGHRGRAPVSVPAAATSTRRMFGVLCTHNMRRVLVAMEKAWWPQSARVAAEMAASFCGPAGARLDVEGPKSALCLSARRPVTAGSARYDFKFRRTVCRMPPLLM